MNAFPASPAVTAPAHRSVATGPSGAPAGSPFSLLADASGESALYVDWRFGFSHGLPGGPRLLPTSADPSAPACDVSVGLRDLDLVIAYRASAPLVAAQDPADLAVKQAQLYLDTRFGGQSPVAARLVRGPQLNAFAVDAAACAEYRLPVADAEGHTHEEILLLVRGGQTMQVTFRYAKDAAPALALATFFSVAKASLSWDPRRPTIAPLLWPESTYLAPGLGSELLPARVAQAPVLVRAFAMDPAEGLAVSEVLESFVGGEEPPWMPLSPASVEAHAQALVVGTSAPAFASMVRSVIADVRTVRDLRGFAILLAKAATLAWTPAPEAPTPSPAAAPVDARFFQPAAALPGSTPPSGPAFVAAPAAPAPTGPQFLPAAVTPASVAPAPFASPPHTVLVPQLAEQAFPKAPPVATFPVAAVPAPIDSVEVLLDAEPDADSVRPVQVAATPAFRVPPPQPPARRPPSLSAPPPKPMTPMRPN